MTVPVHDGATGVAACVGSAADGRRRLYLAAASTYMATLSVGLVMSYSSPALPDIRQKMSISEDDAAWFGSLLMAGGFVGGILSGKFLNLVGRKRTLWMAAVLFAGGWLCLAFADFTALLFVGRFLGGGGMAITSAGSAVFVAEVAPASLRGVLNTGCNFLISLGILLGYVMGKWLDYKWLALACLVPAVISGSAFFFYVRDSPLWLLQKGRRKEAIEAMQFYRGPRIEDEFCVLESCAGNVTGMTMSDVKQPYIYKTFLCALLVLLMQQISAMSIIIFFAEDIFQDAGMSLAPDNCTILVGGILSGTFLVATLLADRVGRKPLFAISTALSAASLAALGLSLHFKDEKGQDFQDKYGWLPLVSIVLYFVGYSLGLGPLPFVFLGELVPLKAKGVATGVCMFIYNLIGFLITKVYADLVYLMGTSATYWLYASLLTVTFVFFILFVPETKGKTLEEIEQLFGKEISPSKLENTDVVMTCHL
uniref:Putative transporter major facilitator superfamily n=1 Tax=Amblyomma cajennense TaxID=34607 RepID=A0A023FJX4_AMBCJ